MSNIIVQYVSMSDLVYFILKSQWTRTHQYWKSHRRFLSSRSISILKLKNNCTKRKQRFGLPWILCWIFSKLINKSGHLNCMLTKSKFTREIWIRFLQWIIGLDYRSRLVWLFLWLPLRLYLIFIIAIKGRRMTENYGGNVFRPLPPYRTASQSLT